MVVVWLNGNTLISITELTPRWARLVLGWVTVSGVQLPVQENIFQCMTSHPGQLSLAIALWVGAVSATATAREENGEFCVTVAPVTRTAMGLAVYAESSSAVVL